MTKIFTEFLAKRVAEVARARQKTTTKITEFITKLLATIHAALVNT